MALKPGPAVKVEVVVQAAKVPPLLPPEADPKAAFHGQAFVLGTNFHMTGVHSIGTTYQPLIKAYWEAFYPKSTDYPVVVVFAANTTGKTNGWSYSSWEKFNLHWAVVQGKP